MTKTESLEITTTVHDKTTKPYLVFVAEIARNPNAPVEETITRQEIATLRNIAHMLAQAMADTAQSMEAQIGLISLTKSVTALTRSLASFSHTKTPSGKQPLGIRKAVNDVEQKISIALRSLDGAKADSGLRQTLMTGLQQLKDMQPRHQQAPRITRTISLRPQRLSGAQAPHTQIKTIDTATRAPKGQVIPISKEVKPSQRQEPISNISGKQVHTTHSRNNYSTFSDISKLNAPEVTEKFSNAIRTSASPKTQAQQITTTTGSASVAPVREAAQQIAPSQGEVFTAIVSSLQNATQQSTSSHATQNTSFMQKEVNQNSPPPQSSPMRHPAENLTHMQKEVNQNSPPPQSSPMRHPAENSTHPPKHIITQSAEERTSRPLLPSLNTSATLLVAPEPPPILPADQRKIPAQRTPATTTSAQQSASPNVRIATLKPVIQPQEIAIKQTKEQHVNHNVGQQSDTTTKRAQITAKVIALTNDAHPPHLPTLSNTQPKKPEAAQPRDSRTPSTAPLPKAKTAELKIAKQHIVQPLQEPAKTQNAQQPVVSAPSTATTKVAGKSEPSSSAGQTKPKSNIFKELLGKFRTAAKGACANCSGGNCATCSRTVHVNTQRADQIFAKYAKN